MNISKQSKMIILKSMVGAILLTGIIIYKIKRPAVSHEETMIDLLIQNGTIVTMNPQKDMYKDGVIAIDKGKIIAVGSLQTIGKKYNAKKIINANNCVVLPGLINAHGHAAMTLLRGFADDLSLQEWLQKYIFPAEAKYVTPDFVYWGTKLACCEMIKGGTTTFVDMYFFEDVVAQAAYEMGMRAIVGQTVTEQQTPDCKTYKQALEHANILVKKWRNNHLITPAIAPHAPYTCSEEILLACKHFSEKHNVPLVTHVSETKNEVEQIRSKYGKRPVVYLDSLGILNNKLIAAHCIHLNEHEIELLRQKKVGVIHAPTSNMKLSSGIAPVYTLLQKKVLVGLGTDGATSNNSLDMVAEMKTAALLQKVSTENPAALNAYQTLELATIGGAQAIHMEKHIGSLETGKNADITLIKIDQIHQIPVYDIISQLIYATKACDVQTVIINGKVIMENGYLLTKSQENELREKIEQYKALIKQPQ